MGALALGHLLRGPGDYHVSTFIAAFGPEVDDMIGALDHVHIMLDHYQGIPLFQQPFEGGKELVDIREVQPRGGLVEDKERPGLSHSYMLGELQPLCLPP